MTAQRSRVTLDEVYVVIGSLIDHIKVLVTAVDDLRCEIEWQARNPVADNERVSASTASSENPEIAVESPEALVNQLCLVRFAALGCWPIASLRKVAVPIASRFVAR